MPDATPTPDAICDFLHEIDGWESAYPLSAFPEPDMRKAAELLKAGGMTLDAISASNMRHVVSRIAPKARAAIAALQAVPAASEVGWQPIESAPKDGKLVVLWQRNFGLHVARWSEGFEEWHGTDWEHTPPIEPTHWMRPEPPALNASGEE